MASVVQSTPQSLHSSQNTPNGNVNNAQNNKTVPELVKKQEIK
jgi:hypothetical protein